MPLMGTTGIRKGGKLYQVLTVYYKYVDWLLYVINNLTYNSRTQCIPL